MRGSAAAAESPELALAVGWCRARSRQFSLGLRDSVKPGSGYLKLRPGSLTSWGLVFLPHSQHVSWTQKDKVCEDFKGANRKCPPCGRWPVCMDDLLNEVG